MKNEKNLRESKGKTTRLFSTWDSSRQLKI
jgi:hypothetical protein